MNKLLLFYLLLCVPVLKSTGQGKLKDGDQIPEFTIMDVNGNLLTQDSFAGKKVLLSFTRNAGCPVCNGYVHQLLEYADSFRLNNIEVFIVSQSPPSSLKRYIEDENLPFRFIPDSADYLYNIFAIEKSWCKEITSVFHGSIRKRNKGKKLYKNKPAFEGSLKTVGADFMIGPDGKIRKAFYGRYVGDRMEVPVILGFFSF